MIFIPVSDDNPLRFVPYQWVTVGLIAVNVIVFLCQIAGIGPSVGASLALVPSELFSWVFFGGSAQGRHDTVSVPEGYTLLTYMFFHADLFLHLSSNMVFLWVFGNNVEDAMGHPKYLIFYLMCGVAGGLAHAWMLPAVLVTPCRCERSCRRRIDGLSDAASACTRLGAGLPRHPRPG